MSNELIEEKAEQFIQSTQLMYQIIFFRKSKNLKQSMMPILELKRCLHLISLIISISIVFNLFFQMFAQRYEFSVQIPVTVAEAERSFSKLKLIKNLMTTMNQDHLSDLGILSIECELARTLNFDNVINVFAKQRARKAHLI